jgi:Uma2 family endonuclease
MATAVFSDSRSLSEDEFFALEQGAERIELFDGSLYVSPGPSPAHQYFYDELKSVLKSGAHRAGLFVHGGVNVRLRPGRVVIPDLAVTSKIDFYDPVIDVASVHLVGEILSPSDATTDEVMKMFYYAVAGIPWYLLIDPETGVLRLHQLKIGEDAERNRYEQHSVVGPGEILRMIEPIVADIDPGELLPPR